MPLWGNSPRQTDTEHRQTYLYVGDLFQLIILILRRDPRRWRNVLLVVGLSQRFRSQLHFYREPQRQKALQNWSRGGLRVRVAICLGLGRISICLCQEDYLYPETGTTFYSGLRTGGMVKYSKHKLLLNCDYNDSAPDHWVVVVAAKKTRNQCTSSNWIRGETINIIIRNPLAD